MLCRPSGVQFVHFDLKLVFLPAWLANLWSFPPALQRFSFPFPHIISFINGDKAQKVYFFVHCFNLKLFLCENHSEGTWLQDTLTKSGAQIDLFIKGEELPT